MADIESLNNPLVKHMVKLGNNKKYREEHKLSVIYGLHLIEEAYKYGFLESVLVNEDSYCPTLSPDVAVSTANQKILTKINLLESPCDIVGIVTYKKSNLPAGDEDCLVLESIQDPGNLGTILRSAKASGIDNVILVGGCADPYNPKVLRSAQGAQFGMNICVMDNVELFLAGYSGKILATTPRARQNIYNIDLTGSVAWIFGNEGTGISEGLLNKVSAHIAIPMANETESLNVAMAATVCLFEQVRQRQVK